MKAFKIVLAITTMAIGAGSLALMMMDTMIGAVGFGVAAVLAGIYTSLDKE